MNNDINRTFNELQKHIYQILNYYLEELGIFMEEKEKHAITTTHLKHIQPLSRIEKRELNKQDQQELMGKHVVYATILSLLVYIQSNIPDIRVTKTFPGCKTSFQRISFNK